MNLFHVTTCEAVDSILVHGLRANKDGEIYAFVDEECDDDIAKWTLNLSVYAFFEIHQSGITGEILVDEHADVPWKQQRLIRQELIRPEHLTLRARQKKYSPGIFLMSFNPRSV